MLSHYLLTLSIDVSNRMGTPWIPVELPCAHFRNYHNLPRFLNDCHSKAQSEPEEDRDAASRGNRDSWPLASYHDGRL